MAHNIKAKKLKYDHYALYAHLKSTVFSSRLKALWLVTSWSDKSSEFQAAQPANTKLRSTNLRRGAGCSHCRLLAKRSRERDEMLKVYATSSDIYDGLHPVCMTCTRVHSLNVSRSSTGRQCSSYKAGVTWSCGLRPQTSLAAAFWTRCNGAVVDFGSPAQTDLQ